jgi:hypothetical protein
MATIVLHSWEVQLHKSHRGRWLSAISALAVGAVLAGTFPVAAASAAPTSDLYIDLTSVEQLQQLVAANPDEFGGVQLSKQDGAVVYTNRTAAMARINGLAPVGKSPTLVSERLKVTIRPAVRSLATLQEARAALVGTGPLALLAREVRVEDYIDFDRGTVVLGVSALSPELRSEVAKYNGAITLQVTQRMVGGRASRYADSAPWSAGATIDNLDGGWSCTSGFAVRHSSGNQRMLTAGHCGVLNEKFTTHNVYVGRIIGRELAANGYDSAILSGSTYSGTSFVGLGAAPGVSSRLLPVKMGVQSVVGETVCMNGAVTGERCDSVVRKVDIRKELDGLVTSHLVETTSLSRQCQHGDSGGPVTRYRDANTLYAMGTIVACYHDKDRGLYVHYYHPIGILESHWGVKLITQ